VKTRGQAQLEVRVVCPSTTAPGVFALVSESKPSRAYLAAIARTHPHRFRNLQHFAAREPSGANGEKVAMLDHLSNRRFEFGTSRRR